LILCDAGPLFALVEPRQADRHRRCKAALARLSAPLPTTWPSFTEAMYLAHRSGGWPMQNILWQYAREELLVFHELGSRESARIPLLMEQYRDAPMDLADASLIATAERLGLREIFTLDSHFYVYRLLDGRSLVVTP
jgi:predicted nucleic acid-binding protein